MAFSYDYYAYGSGSGKDGALTPSAANTVINAYAKVAGINGTVLTLENFSDSSKFTANTHVLIHASAYTGTGKLADIGYWHITTIKSVGEGSTITLDRSNFGLNHVASAISKGGLAQIVTIPEYTTVTLNAGKSITCPQFNQANGYGGIVIFKCSKELIFNGGHINLNGKGLPSAHRHRQACRYRLLAHHDDKERRRRFNNHFGQKQFRIKSCGKCDFERRARSNRDDTRIHDRDFERRQVNHLSAIQSSERLRRHCDFQMLKRINLQRRAHQLERKRIAFGELAT